MNDNGKSPDQKSRVPKTASVLVIGNEILTGRTQDTNTMWIAQKFNEYGIRLSEARVVPDKKDVVIRALLDLSGEYDYLLTTGGIGPTHDDITAECVAEATGRKFKRHEEAYQMLLAHYGSEEEVTPARAKMALMPEGADLIPNPVSGAPGFVIDNIYVMAGVPRIMQAMLDHVIDILEPGEKMLSNTIACSLPESELADDLAKIQEQFPTTEIGSYPHFRSGNQGLSVVLRNTQAEPLAAATNALLEAIHRLGDTPKALSLQVDISQ